MLEKFQTYHQENAPKSGDKNICCHCVENKELSNWLKNHGSKGKCDFDEDHESFYEVFQVKDFIVAVDKFFHENYVEGDFHLIEFPDSEETDYLQLGKPYSEVLQDDLLLDADVFEAVSENMSYHFGYDDMNNCESCLEVEERERLDREEYYEFEAYLRSVEPSRNLKLNLSSLLQLLEINIDDENLRNFQFMMIFTFCITALETFLSDVFKKKLISSKSHKINYLKWMVSNNKLSKKCLEQDDDKINSLTKYHSDRALFHKLSDSEDLYKSLFGVSLEEIDVLAELVEKRHHFIHRSGKNNEEENIVTSKDEIELLIKKIRKMCNNVIRQMSDHDQIPDLIPDLISSADDSLI
jgi:hypothetical protein